jgi:hypothetical protein
VDQVATRDYAPPATPAILFREELESIPESDESSAEENEARKMVGEFQSALLKDLVRPLDRRPILAIASKFKKHTLEKAFNIKISSREYTNVNLHALWPGPMKPVQKTKIFRNRVKDSTIVALLECLETGGGLQRTAFGTKVIELCGGLEFVTIKRIDRKEAGQEISSANFVRKILVIAMV